MAIPRLLTVYLLAVLCAAAGLSLLSATTAGVNPDCPMSNPRVELQIKGQTLTVEIAANPAARSCGLSRRTELARNHGMLFVYPYEQPLSFWMKNTWIPLDIAYLDSDGRILEIHRMDPADGERSFLSSVPARYALETNQGWFRRQALSVGDSIELVLPPELESADSEPAAHRQPRYGSGH